MTLLNLWEIMYLYRTKPEQDMKYPPFIITYDCKPDDVQDEAVLNYTKDVFDINHIVHNMVTAHNSIKSRYPFLTVNSCYFIGIDSENDTPMYELIASLTPTDTGFSLDYTPIGETLCATKLHQN
jgi:hypothetical protein